MACSGGVVVVAALAESRGRVFLARRAPEKRHGGLWELPGGKVEEGEAPSAALAREIREELSLDATVEEPAYDDSVQMVEGARFRFLVYKTRFEREPSESTDHDAWGLFTPDEIPFGLLAPLDSQVLGRWRREAEGRS